MAKSSLVWTFPLAYAILVSAMPGSPVNWYTTSSAILWASRRPSAAGRSKRLVAMSRCSGRGRAGGGGGAAPHNGAEGRSEGGAAPRHVWDSLGEALGVPAGHERELGDD